MAEQDFTPVAVTLQNERAANVGAGHDGPPLGIVQLYAIKAIMDARVMSAVAAIQDPLGQRAGIIAAYCGLAADLLAKFSVGDVIDIPSRHFAAAREFPESAALATVSKTGARA